MVFMRYQIYIWSFRRRAYKLYSKKEDLEERYYLDENQNLYMEFYFQDSNNNMNGFVSIFDMRVEDLEDETKESDIFLVKYLKDN